MGIPGQLARRVGPEGIPLYALVRLTANEFDKGFFASFGALIFPAEKTHPPGYAAQIDDSLSVMLSAVQPGSEGHLIGSPDELAAWLAIRGPDERAEPFTFVSLDGSTSRAPPARRC